MKLRTALAAGASVLLGGGFSAVLAGPAQAADGPDLALKIASSKIAVDAPMKAFRLDAANVGTADAANVALKLDFSGLDTTRVDFVPELFIGCEVSGKVVTCVDGPVFVAGESLSLPVLLENTGGKVGAAGSFTATFSTSSGDVNPANNTATVAVEVVDSGADLQSFAFDLSAGYDDDNRLVPLSPGDSTELMWWVTNEGGRFVKGVDFTITLPPYVSFDDPYGICEVEEQATEVLTCSDPDAIIPPGGMYFPELPQTVTVNQFYFDGPAALPGGLVSAKARTLVEDVPDWAQARPATGFDVVGKVTDQERELLLEKVLKKSMADAEEAVEIDEGDNDAAFAAHIGAPVSVDQAITVTPATGPVGSVVQITVKVSNIGEASTGPMFYIKAPSGTSFVAPEQAPEVGSCIDRSGEGPPWTYTGETELACGWESELQPGRTLKRDLLVRIDDAAVGNDGLAEVITSVGKDRNPENDTAKVVIKVGTAAPSPSTSPSPSTDPGAGLPVTGANVGLVAGVGGAVVLAGAVLLLLARRRRVTITDDTAH
ncbi:hypothetical protein [Catellatospora sp. NPDC049609]|uniref:hypothetical protein n=1 Tax=Catellatospora sp. NPDC049609 TaxID=3155505 RepID=UPI00341D71D9